jgi:murein DD-endopeptidase MepM/ murein hydrolase activator NlpD
MNAGGLTNGGSSPVCYSVVSTRTDVFWLIQCRRRRAATAGMVALAAGVLVVAGPPANIVGRSLQASVTVADAVPVGAEATHAAVSLLTRTAYLDSLDRAGAGPVAPWMAAAAAALLEPPTVRPPYTETGRFTTLPDAFGYRIELKAGERLHIDLAADDGNAFFLELFHDDAPDTGPDAFRNPVLSLAGNGELEHESNSDGAVLLRLQPRPGMATAYTLRLSRSAALVFPVAWEGATVISQFLEGRDDGERLHLGIDIAAPRGAPVVAAAAGTVDRVEETELGGLVIWLRETHSGRMHYYAHLDSRVVTSGAAVAAGQVIGTVGTTGNAPETTPHLHFGVYRDHVALDPLRYVDVPAGEAETSAPAGARGLSLRARARTRVTGAALRTINRDEGAAVSLPQGFEVEILAEAGRLRRVRTATGQHGFLAGWLLEPFPALTGVKPR